MRPDGTFSTIEQLGLFDAPSSRLAAARRALARFDLDAAARELEAHLGTFASDELARELLATTERWRVTRDAHAGGGSELDGVLALRGVVGPELTREWHRRVAELAEREGRAEAEGEPAGAHWLAAGEAPRAVESLREAVTSAPRAARSRALLADALYRSRELEPARHEYLRAFLDDPAAIAADRIADPEVAGLLDLARDEYELDEPVAAWVPAVGIVERVFALPLPALPGLEAAAAAGAPPAREFLELIARERASRALEDRVAPRRRMKQLAPALFAAYLRAFA